MAGRAKAILGVVVASAVAGVLVTAMVTPAIAIGGVAVGTTLDAFDSLPDYIKPDTLSQTSSIYAQNADGTRTLLASFYDQNRQEVGWNDISQYFKDAIVSTEDPRFYVHGGMDVQSSVRALIANTVSGSVESGASTISQQYVKNILVQRAEAISDPTAEAAAYAEATATTADRKIKELKLAIGLEKEYSKDDILLGYMNIALFGGRVYGVQAAAQYYFGVDAKDLTLPQAASLAAIVNEPEALRIDVDAEHTAANKARRDEDILASMLKEHAITQAQFDEAVATPVTPNITEPSTGCQTAADGAGYFCDYVKQIILNDPTFGATADDRANALNRGGYTIVTTLDPELQAAANQAVNDYVPSSMSSVDIGGAFVTVQPGTGKVVAMAQNKTYSQDPAADPATNTAINYSTDADYGGSTGFQNGSTSKLFVLLDWLKTGHSLSDIVNGSNNQKFTAANITNSCGDTVSGTYTAGNDAGEAGGNASVLTQFEDSVNNAFLAMATKLDLCDINAIASAFGMHRADGAPMETGLYASVLGGNEVSPLTMAAAYAGVANDGMFCTPVAISSITDATGADVAVPQSTCTQAIDPIIAKTALYAMQGVIQAGTATPANPADGTAHFGKTGTTDAEKDVWLVGGTSQLVSASWVGNVTGNVSIRQTAVTGDNGVRVGSGLSRLYVWKEFYKSTADARGGTAFPLPASARSGSGSGSGRGTATPTPTPAPSSDAPPAPAASPSGTGSPSDDEAPTPAPTP